MCRISLKAQVVIICGLCVREERWWASGAKWSCSICNYCLLFEPVFVHKMLCHGLGCAVFSGFFQHTSENPPLSMKMMLCCVTVGLLEVRPADDSESKRHVLPAGLFSLLGHANLVPLNTGDIRIQEQDQRSDIHPTNRNSRTVQHSGRRSC